MAGRLTSLYRRREVLCNATMGGLSMPTFSFTPIDVPGSTVTFALDINDRG